MRSLLVVLFVQLGCGPPSTMVAHRQVVSDPILDGWRPDYAYPFVRPRDHGRQKGELADACRRGEASACWKADLHEEVAASCRRGHRLSCRAVLVDDRLPGAYGRHWGRCVNDLDDCDLVVLWDECRADFTRSCKKARSVLADLHIPFVDDALRERIVNLGRTGCAQGIAYDCAFLAAHGTRAEGLLADETRCRHDHAHCHNLARRVFLDGDVARAHRLLEYTCQQGIMAACERLGALYVKRELREPLDGRGVRLLELACRFRIDKGALFKSAPDTYFQQCMDRTGMWETYDRAFYAPLERVEPP